MVANLLQTNPLPTTLLPTQQDMQKTIAGRTAAGAKTIPELSQTVTNPLLSQPASSVQQEAQAAAPQQQTMATTAAPAAPAAPVAAPAPGVTPTAAPAVAPVAAPVAGQAPTMLTPSDNSLVAKQLGNLLSSDSPYIQAARTRAAQQANSRGLLNSSIAAGAGELAAIQAGLPIAQQDAATFGNADQFNASAKNVFARDENQNAFTLQRDEQQFANRLKEMTAATDEQLRVFEAQGQKQLADSYRQVSQATYDTYVSEVQRIQESDMDPDVKAQQVASLQGLFQSRQAYVNTVFKMAPQWSSDWSQFGLEFDGGANG